MIDLQKLVEALGGRVTGEDSCDVPGPGHSKQDHSLSSNSIRMRPTASSVSRTRATIGGNAETISGLLPGFCHPRNHRKQTTPARDGTCSASLSIETRTTPPYLRVRKYLDESDKKRYVQARWMAADG